jgi:hypothetical protein
LARAVADAPHHRKDRRRIFGGVHDQRFDRAAHHVLRETKGEDRLDAFALHRESKTVQERFGVAELSAVRELRCLLILRHGFASEGIEVG